MKTIFDKSLLSLAPKLAKDKYEDVFKVCEILIQKYLVNQLKRLVHFDRVDEMEEFELDLLSRELHIDYYNPQYTLEEKRKVCKDSIQTHMKKGTVGAVKSALNIYFEKYELKTWYEHKLERGYFNVDIYDKNFDYMRIVEIKKIINNSKKFSQHLKNLTFFQESNISLKYYGAVHDGGRKIDRYNLI